MTQSRSGIFRQALRIILIGWLGGMAGSNYCRAWLNDALTNASNGIRDPLSLELVPAIFPAAHFSQNSLSSLAAGGHHW